MYRVILDKLILPGVLKRWLECQIIPVSIVYLP
jgi:hypothetical protein